MVSKQERLEKKKRKIVALANIIKINENDKMEQSKKASEGENSVETTIEIVSEETNGEQPDVKKMKLMNCQSSIPDDLYKELRKDLSERKKALNNAPHFKLCFNGEKASMKVHPSKRQPLMLEDMQYLLMTGLLGSNSPFKPNRWCTLRKANKVSHTVLLVVEGLTSYDFMSNESCFIKTKGIFEDQLEVVLPRYQKNELIEELSCVPLTQSLKEKLIIKYGSLEAAINLNREHHLIAKSVFPVDDEAPAEDPNELPEGDAFSRTRLLLSPLQMLIEGYPMPLSGEFRERFESFRMSKESYKPVTSKSPMFGLDCEMCRTVKAENELARVSIVDENYKSVYETLVRPTNKIVDYLTPWSGITKEMMENVVKTLEEVQEDVKNLLPPDAILVGQSLNCDLMAMKLMHPYVIDTSVIFNITGQPNKKSKLQLLTKTFLDEEIQTDKTGHSSIEDSTASLKLTKLKLSKDIYFGDLALESKREQGFPISQTGIVKNSEEGDKTPSVEVKTTLFCPSVRNQKKSAIITTENSELDLEKYYSKNQFQVLLKGAAGEGDDNVEHGVKHHKVSSAKKVIKKTREILLENAFNMSYFNIIDDCLDEDVNSGDAQQNGDEKRAEFLTEFIPKIDRWIEKLWNSVAVNGLFVVMFGGHHKNSNGVSMIRIKN